MQRFRGGLVFKAHRLCVSLNSRLESNKEEEEHMAAMLSNKEEEEGFGFDLALLTRSIRTPPPCFGFQLELVFDDLTLFLSELISKFLDLSSQLV